MPAEFEPHEGCWMLWPERPDNWRRARAPAQQAFAAVATAIARFEPVTVGVSAPQYARARAALPASACAWWNCRATMPGCAISVRAFVVNAAGSLRGVHWRFNAWGGLYRDFRSRPAVAQKVLRACRLRALRAPFINEGGAIHVDGQGTVLVTEQCLLNRNRNPSLSRDQLENLLKRYLGARCVIWLGEGVIDDETSGHIDNLACFARPGEVCLTWCEDRRDPSTGSRGMPRASDGGARCARAERLRVHKTDLSGTALHDAAGGGWNRLGRGHPRACGRVPPGRELRQFLSGQQCRDPAVAGRAYRRARAARIAAAFSRNGASSASRRARFCSVAGISIASRSSSRHA